MINSGEFTRHEELPTPSNMIAEIAAERGRRTRKTVNYKLRDWLISRQRYWGTSDTDDTTATACGWVPEKEENLPVKTA